MNEPVTDTVRGRVSRRAKGGWDRFAKVHGVTISALAEAAGQMYADLSDEQLRTAPPSLLEMVERAHQVEFERNRRRWAPEP